VDFFSGLCLKGLHLSLWSLPSGKGQIDYGQSPPSIKILVRLSSFRPYGVRRFFFIAWRGDRSRDFFNRLAGEKKAEKSEKRRRTKRQGEPWSFLSPGGVIT